MSVRSRFLAFPSFRLRTVLVLIAAIAVPLGLYFGHIRRQERRRAMRYDVIAAAKDGDLPRLRNLLDAGADVNSVVDGRFPWSPLMHAAYEGRVDAARLLIERGADLDQEDLDFFGATTIAAGEGHWEIVRILVEAGADTSRTDGYGHSAYDYAKADGPAAMVGLLGSKPHPPLKPVAGPED